MPSAPTNSPSVRQPVTVRSWFYSFDCNEPMHVHVRRDRQQAKFWLAPAALAWNHGFRPRELNEIRRLVVDHKEAIIETWDEHCG
ncbi:MAG: DUF4160 domain-containing protein [Vicinamibacterales bacterium]